MKIIKIVFINLLIILLLWFITEIRFYNYFCKISNIKIPFFDNKIESLLENYHPDRFIPFDKNNKNKSKPILLLGCSYTYGQWLNDNETFSYKLAKYTNRHIYNWGIVGHGPTVLLALLKKEEKKPLITEKPEYVIYTYMFTHIQRYGWYPQFYNFLRQEELIPFQKYNFLYYSYIYQYLKKRELENYYGTNFEKKYNLFIETLKKIKEQSDKLYPNSKFVVLLYADINYDLCKDITGTNNEQLQEIEQLFSILYSQKFRKDIQNLGIYVISTENLIGRKMDKKEDRIQDDPSRPHPSAKTWDEIVPKLSKKLNL